jgi:hypothetical protein
MATTSGTATFNLDILQICEEAFERAGLELRSGYDLTTARRSLHLLSLELSNKGLNLFTVAQSSLSLVSGTATYTPAEAMIDIIEHVVRTGSGTSQVDYPLTRVSVSTYASRTNKGLQSRPTDIYIDRQTDNVQVTVWPTPDTNDWTLVYWYLRRVEDLGANTNNYDAPERFIPAICAGLAYYIAMKKPESIARLPMLRDVYAETLMDAFNEDREKADMYIRPHIGRI